MNFGQQQSAMLNLYWRGNCQYTAIGFKANVFVKGGKEFCQCSRRLLLWEWNTVFALFHFICVCVVSSSYYYLFLVFLCSLKALTRTPGSKLRLGHKLYEVLDKTKKKWLWHGMGNQGSALRKIEGSLVAWTCKFEGAHHNNLNKNMEFSSCPRAKVGCQGPQAYTRAFFSQSFLSFLSFFLFFSSSSIFFFKPVPCMSIEVV